MTPGPGDCLVCEDEELLAILQDPEWGTPKHSAKVHRWSDVGARLQRRARDERKLDVAVLRNNEALRLRVARVTGLENGQSRKVDRRSEMAKEETARKKEEKKAAAEEAKEVEIGGVCAARKEAHEAGGGQAGVNACARVYEG